MSFNILVPQTCTQELHFIVHILLCHARIIVTVCVLVIKHYFCGMLTCLIYWGVCKASLRARCMLVLPPAKIMIPSRLRMREKQLMRPRPDFDLGCGDWVKGRFSVSSIWKKKCGCSC